MISYLFLQNLERTEFAEQVGDRSCGFSPPGPCSPELAAVLQLHFSCRSSWACTPLPLSRRPLASSHRRFHSLLRTPHPPIPFPCLPPAPHPPIRAHHPLSRSPAPPLPPTTLKSLKILTLDALSRTTYSFESALHTNSSAWPNDLLRHASAVYTMYSPSPHTVTKRPLGLCSRVYQEGGRGVLRLRDNGRHPGKPMCVCGGHKSERTGLWLPSCQGA